MMDAQREEILAYAEGLSPGSQVAGLLCPFCGGGESRDLSFSVGVEPKSILFMCHRDKCAAKGTVNSGGTVITARSESPPVKKDKVYTGRLVNIPEKVSMAISRKYGIGTMDLRRAGCLWAPDMMPRERLWMPVRAFDGTPIGGVARSLEVPPDKPKTLMYHFRHKAGKASTPLLAWYLSDSYRAHPAKASGKALLLVEDQISAIKASSKIDTVALLGTHISEQSVRYMLDCGYSNIILALDSDATSKAISHRQRWGALFDSFSIMVLTKDLKYEDRDTIRSKVNEVLPGTVAEKHI